ncbi:MAG: hypothetical protein IPM46_07650 [Flavobacteriales bacterium]|nr:hypothetical protein [Flavobacteriales bacterium]
MRFGPPNSRMATFLLIVFLFGQSGCIRYHRHPLKSSSLPRMVDYERSVYFVIHGESSNEVWHIREPAVTRDSISGIFELYPQDMATKLLTADGNREYKQQRNRLLLHAAPLIQFNLKDGTASALSLSTVREIEVIDLDAGATVGLTVLAVAGVFAAIILIILATKSSCPFIYTQGADGFHFEGEVFSGSIYPQLQRHDRLPLHHLESVDGEYRVRVANKAHEIQHTDLLELVAVDHPPGMQVLFDREGQALTFGAPLPIRSARDRSGVDVRALLSEADDNAWLGDPQNDRPNADDGIEITFAKPIGQKTANLMVRAKNTFWVDHLYGLFLDEFGTYSDEMQALNSGKSADELRAWSRDQNLPLAVLIEDRPGHWTRVGQFELAGPMAWREDALQIDISGIQGEVVRLKLETGFMFWEIDHVALDRGPVADLTIQQIKPSSAIDQEGNDVLTPLLKEDGACLVQPALDDLTEILFTAPPLASGSERSLFLHAAGHYEILREPATHTPSLLYLRSFNDAGAFPKYSRDRWNDTRALEFRQPL